MASSSPSQKTRPVLRSEEKIVCSFCEEQYPSLESFKMHATKVHNELALTLIKETKKKLKKAKLEKAKLEKEKLEKAKEKRREKEKAEEKEKEKAEEKEKEKEKAVEKDDDDEDEDEDGKCDYQCELCEEVFPKFIKLLEHAIHHLPPMNMHRSEREDEDELYFGQLAKVRPTPADEDESDYEKPGTEVWFTDESIVALARSHADAALDFFNKVNYLQNGGKRYGLVEHGPIMCSYYAIEHINFKAKEKGRVNAPVETFFAQVQLYPGRRVQCCVSLGPSALLPHWRKADLGGCKLCNGIIHHPTTGPVDNLCLE